MLSTDILEGWKSYNGGPPCGRKFQICLPYNLFSVDWFTGVNWTFIIKPKTIHLNFDGSVHSSFGKNRKDSPRRYHKQISLKFSMSSYVVFSHLHNRKTNSHKTRNPFFENAKMWKPFRWKSHTQKTHPSRDESVLRFHVGWKGCGAIISWLLQLWAVLLAAVWHSIEIMSKDSWAGIFNELALYPA